MQTVNDKLKESMELIYSRNPATGETLQEFSSTPIDALPKIFQQARAAQEQWASLPPKKRAQKLLFLRETLISNADSIIELISKETGKPRFEAMIAELIPVIETLTYFSSRGPRLLKDKRIKLRLFKHRTSYLNHWPLGVVAVISPWNYPFILPFADIIMALMAGNAVVFKPSEATPSIGLRIQSLCEEAGLPAHLVQTVLGTGTVGAAIIQQKPAKIFFTGSVPTGKKIMAAAAEHLIPVNLELGGKDAMIVLPDADLDYASSAALWGGFTNAGQTCAAVERVLVHESQSNQFLSLLSEKLKQLKQDPSDGEDNDIGPIIFPRQSEVYRSHLEEARKKGAIFVTGGEFSDDERYLRPTIVTGPGVENLKIYNEETFGPVVAVTTYKTLDEAIRKANDSRYGLLASVISRNISNAEDVARQLEVGTVTVNEVLYTAGLPETPWGGVKETGFGRTHSDMGLYEFTHIRHIHKPKSRLFTFKSLWWYPYTDSQYLLFRRFIELYRRHWLDKLKALPHFLAQLVEFLKKDRRL